MKDISETLAELTMRAEQDQSDRMEKLLDKHMPKVIRLCKATARAEKTILMTADWKTGRRILELPFRVDEIEFWRRMASRLGLSFDWETGPRFVRIFKLRWAYKESGDWKCESEEKFEEWAASFGGDDRKKGFFSRFFGRGYQESD